MPASPTATAGRPGREGADLGRRHRRHRPGLTLLGLSHGPAVAQAVQLALEYDPQPPYDAGTPAKAPAEIGELVSSYYAQRCS